MSEPFFQKTSWTPFIYEGQTYSLDHLNEHRFEVHDSTGALRAIAVTFSDHCFTRDPQPSDSDRALQYTESSRRPGYFCFDRYEQSVELPVHLDRLRQPRSPVWTVNHGSYAVIPTVNQAGVPMLYGILFTLDRVTGLPVDLHMRVRTAYPCDKRALDTFGSTRFEHLVTLRMQGKHPQPRYEKNRKRPVLKQDG